MNKRFYVEPRASKDYPWQFVDIKAGLRAGPVSIHKTKRQAEKAREAYKKMLAADQRENKRLIERRRAEREAHTEA